MFDTCSFKPTNDGFPPSSGGGGGAVTSVFGRTGVVIAVAGDYTSSEITNSSTVTGTYVTDALNTLDTTKASLNSAVTFGSATPDIQFEVLSNGAVQVKSGILLLGSTNISGNFAGYLGLQNSNGTVFETYGGDFPSNINFTRRIQTLNATYDAGTVLTKLNSGSSDVEWGLRNISDYAVSKTLTNGNIIVGNGSNVATAVAMSGDATIINTGAVTISNDAVTTAKILNSNVTYAKIQNVAATRLLGNSTGSPAAPEEITLGTNLSFTGTTLNAAGGGGYTYLAITLSANTSYNKAALGGANYLFISTNDATTRTITINSTGFVANDFLVLSFNGASLGIITLIIGTNPLTLTSNRGNTIFGVYNGTEWTLQSMANSYLTGSSANLSTLAIGLGASAFAGQNISIGGGATGTGLNCVRVGFANTGAAAGVTYLGSIAAATAADCIVIGRAAQNISATSGIVIGAAASITGGSAGTVVGYQSTSSGGTVLGYNCSGGNTTTVCIGTNSTGTGNNTTVIGSSTTVGTNTGVVAIGQGITTTNTDAVVIGRAASAGGTANVTIGASATGTGANCVRVGNTAVTNNATTSVAIGQGVTIGTGGANVVAIGQGVNTGTNTGVVAIGQGITTTNTDAVVIGRAASGGNIRGVSIGAFTKTVRNNSVRFRLDNSTSSTDATYPSHNLEFIGLMATTTNSTPTEMFVGNDGVSKITLQANNQLAFTGSCQAYKSTQDASAKWDFSGMIRRDGANNTSIVGTTVLTMVQSDGVGSGLILDITADDTTENLKFTARGNTGETWYWFADVKLNDLKIA